LARPDNHLEQEETTKRPTRFLQRNFGQSSKYSFVPIPLSQSGLRLSSSGIITARWFCEAAAAGPANAVHSRAPGPVNAHLTIILANAIRQLPAFLLACS
jgi:hypothetical protein